MSAGMFINTPVAISIWYGTPIQMLIMMMVNMAQPGWVRNGM